MTTFQWFKARGYDSEVALWVHSKNDRALHNLIEKTDSHTLNEYLKEVHPEEVSNDLTDEEIRSLMYDDMGIEDEYSELLYRKKQNYTQLDKKLTPLIVILILSLIGVFTFVIITLINNM